MAVGRVIGGLIVGFLLATFVAVIMGKRELNKNEQHAINIQNIKQWPDLYCHAGPGHNDHTYQTMWYMCLGRENSTGVCAKMCYLRGRAIIYQMRNASDPVVFDIDSLVHYVQDYLGTNNWKTWLPIKEAAQKCKTDHPEWVDLKGVKTTTCEPWAKILVCLENAFGCMGKGNSTD